MKRFVLDNLLTLLKGDDGKLRNIYIDNLPNMKNFKLISQGENIPMQSIQISKKVVSHLELEAFVNKRINRYVEHQVIRLKALRSDPVPYGALAAKLLRSKVGVLIHLNRVYPKGYRAAPLGGVLKNINSMKSIVLDFKGDIDFSRVYIPKVTNSLKEGALNGQHEGRPLGVPTLPWRIYLSMLNTILVIWLEPSWHPQQHGYFPKKGTLTAWRELMGRINSPDIYEFDLKQFFPSVQIQAVSQVLRDLNTPKGFVEYIENLNKSKPKLAKVDLVDERKVREAQDLEQGRINREQDWYQPVKGFIEANGIEIGHELLREDVGGITVYHEFEFVQLQAALFASFKPEQTFHGTFEGLPQGGGISPTLSVQTLNYFLNKNDALMYADDGLLFHEPKFDDPRYEEVGIRINYDKSGGVKRAGKGLKPLKFLGLVYDGNKDKLYSQTRKGKTLEIGRGKFGFLRSAGELFGSDGKTQRNNTGYELMMSRISGFVQACLYSGTFNLSQYGERGEVTAHGNSGQKSKAAKRYFKKYKMRANLYNSSSVACKGFMNRRQKK